MGNLSLPFPSLPRLPTETEYWELARQRLRGTEKGIFEAFISQARTDWDQGQRDETSEINQDDNIDAKHLQSMKKDLQTVTRMLGCDVAAPRLPEITKLYSG